MGARSRRKPKSEDSSPWEYQILSRRYVCRSARLTTAVLCRADCRRRRCKCAPRQGNNRHPKDEKSHSAKHQAKHMSFLFQRRYSLLFDDSFPATNRRTAGRPDATSPSDDRRHTHIWQFIRSMCCSKSGSMKASPAKSDRNVFAFSGSESPTPIKPKSGSGNLTMPSVSMRAKERKVFCSRFSASDFY